MTRLLELILLLKKKGIRVPNDVSVVGYIITYMQPERPTDYNCEVNVEAMSQMAVASIIRNAKSVKQQKNHSGKIIVRIPYQILLTKDKC